MRPFSSTPGSSCSFVLAWEAGILLRLCPPQAHLPCSHPLRGLATSQSRTVGARWGRFLGTIDLSPYSLGFLLPCSQLLKCPCPSPPTFHPSGSSQCTHPVSCIEPVKGSASDKESTCQCRRCKRCRFNPWVGKIPWSRKWQTLQYSCLENSMD